MTEAQLFTIALVGLIVTPLVTLFTTFMVQAFQWSTSAEQRRRDVEDKKEAVKQAKLAAEAAQKSAKESASAIKIVHQEVIKVGEQATAAYKEANQSNLKIQAVQDALTTSLSLPQKPITETTGAEVPKEEKQETK